MRYPVVRSDSTEMPKSVYSPREYAKDAGSAAPRGGPSRIPGSSHGYVCVVVISVCAAKCGFEAAGRKQ